MNICHVISGLSPRFGGPTVVVKELAREQVKLGHAVVIHTTNVAPRGVMRVPTDVPLKQDGYTVWYHSIKSPKALCYSPGLAKTLRKTIRDFQIVHIHGLYRFPQTYAGWLARRYNVPYIICPHGSLDPFLYEQSRFGRAALPVKRLYERLFDLPNLNHASAVQYTAREEMLRASFLNIRAPAIVVPNGVRWEEYEHLPPRGAFRRRIHVAQDTPLVLFLGRINFIKGLDLLIPSFAQVLKRVPKAHLAIVGPDDDGYGAKVKRWIREYGIIDQVSWVGFLDREATKSAFVDADVYVLPSYSESFGITVVEAMSCGLPVIISDQVNIWQEIQTAGAGWVVPLKVTDLSEAISRLLLQPDVAKAMGIRGRALAKERYSWSQIVALLETHYQQIVHSNSRRRGV